MHSRKSIFKRGIAFIAAIFAMTIFTQTKVGAACEVALADKMEYLTFSSNQGGWTDSAISYTGSDCPGTGEQAHSVYVNGENKSSFVPQDYTDGHYTVEYRYSLDGATHSIYRYVRILNSNFDTSKNYTLGAFNAFEKKENKVDAQIINAFYDSSNNMIINFVVNNDSTYIVVTNLVGKELARTKITYLKTNEQEIVATTVLQNENSYYVIGNTSDSGVFKKYVLNVVNKEITFNEDTFVMAYSANSKYYGGYFVSDSEIYLVGQNQDNKPVIEVATGTSSISNVYTHNEIGAYLDIIEKDDYLYSVGYTTVSATKTNGLYTQLKTNGTGINNAVIFEENAKFTKIINSNSDRENNIIIGETHALQIYAGGSISAVNTRAGYSDALVLRVSNNGEIKQNAGLYGTATNDIFNSITYLGNGKYSLVGKGNDGNSTLVYTLDTKDYSVVEENVSSKTTYGVNGAVNLPYGVGYYGEITSNKELVVNVYYPHQITVSDPMLLILDNRTVEDRDTKEVLSNEIINLATTGDVGPSVDDTHYKYCYYVVRFSNGDNYPMGCDLGQPDRYIPSKDVTPAGKVAETLEYVIETKTGATMLIYRNVRITEAPVPINLTSSQTGILKWYTYNRPYTYTNSNAARLDFDKTRHEIILQDRSIFVDYTANYEYVFDGVYATQDIYDMISYYFDHNETNNYVIRNPQELDPNKKIFEHSNQTSAAFASIEYAKMFAYYQEFSRVVKVSGNVDFTMLSASRYPGQNFIEGQDYYIYYIDFIGNSGGPTIDSCSVSRNSISNCSGKAGYAFANLDSVNRVIKDFLLYNNYFVGVRNTIYNGSIPASEVEEYYQELYTVEYRNYYAETSKSTNANLTLNVYELIGENESRLVYKGKGKSVYFGGKYNGMEGEGESATYKIKMSETLEYTGLSAYKDNGRVMYYYDNSKVVIINNACYEIYYSYIQNETETKAESSKKFCLDNTAPEIEYHEHDAKYGDNKTHNASSGRGNKSDTPAYISSDFDILNLIDIDKYAYIMVGRNVYPLTCAEGSETCEEERDTYIKQTFRYNQANPNRINEITFADRTGNTITFYFIIGTAAPSISVTELTKQNIASPNEEPENVTTSFALDINFYETNVIQDFMITNISKQECSNMGGDPCYNEENAQTLFSTEGAATLDFNEMVTHYIYAVTYRDKKHPESILVINIDRDGLYQIGDILYRIVNNTVVEALGYEEKYNLQNQIYIHNNEEFALENNYFVRNGVVYNYYDGIIQPKVISFDYKRLKEEPDDWAENYNKYYVVHGVGYAPNNTDQVYKPETFYERSVDFVDYGAPIILSNNGEFNFGDDGKTFRYVEAEKGAYVEVLPRVYEIESDNTFRIKSYDTDKEIVYTYDKANNQISYTNPLLATSKNIRLIFTRTIKTAEGVQGGVDVPYTKPLLNQDGTIAKDPDTGLDIYLFDTDREDTSRHFYISDGIYTFNINQESGFGFIESVTGSMFVKKLDLKTGYVTHASGVNVNGLLLHNPATPYIIDGITGGKFDFSGTETGDKVVQLTSLNDEFVYPISSSVVNDLSGYEKTYFMNKSVYVGFTMKTDVVFRIKASTNKNHVGLPAGANACREVIIFGTGYNKNIQSKPVSNGCSSSTSIYLSSVDSYDSILYSIGVYDVSAGSGSFIFSGDNTFYEVEVAQYKSTDFGYSLASEILKETFYIDASFDENTIDGNVVNDSLVNNAIYSFKKEDGINILTLIEKDDEQNDVEIKNPIVGGNNHVSFNINYYTGQDGDTRENRLMLINAIINGDAYFCNVYKVLTNSNYASECMGDFVNFDLSEDNNGEARLVFTKSADYTITFADPSGGNITYRFVIDKSAPTLALDRIDNGEIQYEKEEGTFKYETLAYVKDPVFTITINDGLSPVDQYCYRFAYDSQISNTSCVNLQSNDVSAEVNISLSSSSVGRALIEYFTQKQHDGNVVMYVNAKDNLGNITEDEIEIHFWVDYKAPDFGEVDSQNVNKLYVTNAEIEANNMKNNTITINSSDYAVIDYVCESSGFKFIDANYKTETAPYTYIVGCSDDHNTSAGTYPEVRKFDNTITLVFYEVSLYTASSDTEIDVNGVVYTISYTADNKLVLTNSVETDKVYTATTETEIKIEGIDYRIAKNGFNALTLKTIKVTEGIDGESAPELFQFGIPTIGNDARWIYITAKDVVGNVQSKGVYLPIHVSDGIAPKVEEDGVKKCLYDNVDNPECKWETLPSHLYQVTQHDEKIYAYYSNSNVKVIFDEYIKTVSSCTVYKASKGGELISIPCDYLDKKDEYNYSDSMREFVFTTDDSDIGFYKIISFRVKDFAGGESSEVIIIIDRIDPVIEFKGTGGDTVIVEYSDTQTTLSDKMIKDNVEYAYKDDLNISDDQDPYTTTLSYEFYRYAPLVTYNNYIKEADGTFRKLNNYQPKGNQTYYLLINFDLVDDKKCEAETTLNGTKYCYVLDTQNTYYFDELLNENERDGNQIWTNIGTDLQVISKIDNKTKIGVYKLAYQVTDYAGNKSNILYKRIFVMDTIDPDIDIKDDRNNPIYPQITTLNPNNFNGKINGAVKFVATDYPQTISADAKVLFYKCEMQKYIDNECDITSNKLFNTDESAYMFGQYNSYSFRKTADNAVYKAFAYDSGQYKYETKLIYSESGKDIPVYVLNKNISTSYFAINRSKVDYSYTIYGNKYANHVKGNVHYVESDTNYVEIRNSGTALDVSLNLVDLETYQITNISKNNAIGAIGRVERVDNGNFATFYYYDSATTNARVVYEIKYEKYNSSEGFMIHKSYYYIKGNDVTSCLVGKQDSDCEKDPSNAYTVAAVTARIYEDRDDIYVVLMDTYGNSSEYINVDIDNTPYLVNKNDNKPTGVNFWYAVPKETITSANLDYYSQVKVNKYEVLNSKPAGWDSTYTSYYIKNGDSYVANTSPTFEKGLYYQQKVVIDRDVNITKSNYDGNLNSSFFYAISSYEEAKIYMYYLYKATIDSQTAYGYTFHDIFGNPHSFAQNTTSSSILKAGESGILSDIYDFIIPVYVEDKKFDENIKQVAFEFGKDLTLGHDDKNVQPSNSTMYQYTYLLRTKNISNSTKEITYTYSLPGDTCVAGENQECIKVDLRIASKNGESIKINLSPSQHKVTCLAIGLGDGDVKTDTECGELALATVSKEATIIYIDQDNPNSGAHTNVVYYGVRVYAESADISYVELGGYVPLEKMIRYSKDGEVYNKAEGGNYVWVDSKWFNLDEYQNSDRYINSCKFNGVNYTTGCVFVTYLSRYEQNSINTSEFDPKENGNYYYDYYREVYSSSKQELMDSVSQNSKFDVDYTYSSEGNICTDQSNSCPFIPNFVTQNVTSSESTNEKYVNKKTYVELFNSKNITLSKSISRLYEIRTTVNGGKFSEITSYATLTVTRNGILKYYNINSGIIRVDGYTLLTSKPQDWDKVLVDGANTTYGYSQYYKINQSGEYVVNESDAQWALGQFYVKDAFAYIVDIDNEATYQIDVSDSAGNAMKFVIAHTAKTPTITYTKINENTNSDVSILIETKSQVSALSDTYLNIYKYDLKNEEYVNINNDKICFIQNYVSGELSSQLGLTFTYNNDYSCSGVYKVEIRDNHGNSRFKEFVFNPYSVDSRLDVQGDAENTVYRYGEDKNGVIDYKHVIANKYLTLRIDSDLQYLKIYKYPAYTNLSLDQVSLSDVEIIEIYNFNESVAFSQNCPINISNRGEGVYSISIVNSTLGACDGVYKVEVFDKFSLSLTTLDIAANLEGTNNYVMLSSRPDDWATNYTKYYYLENGKYIQIKTNSLSFEADKYYTQVVASSFITNDVGGYTVELDSTAPSIDFVVGSDKIQHFNLSLDDEKQYNYQDTETLIKNKKVVYSNKYVTVSWGGEKSYSFTSLHYREKINDGEFGQWIAVGDNIGYITPFNAYHQFAPTEAGLHTYEFKFVDKVGNENANGIYTIEINVIPPKVGLFEVKLDAYGNPIYKNGSVEVLNQYNKDERISTTTVLKCMEDDGSKNDCDFSQYQYELRINGILIEAFTSSDEEGNALNLANPISPDSRFLIGTGAYRAEELSIELTVYIKGKVGIATVLTLVIDKKAPVIKIDGRVAENTTTYVGDVEVILDTNADKDPTNIAWIYKCDAIEDNGIVAKCIKKLADGREEEIKDVYATIEEGVFRYSIPRTESGYFLIIASDDPIRLGNTSYEWFVLDNQAPTIQINDGLSNIAPFMYTNANSVKASVIDALSPDDATSIKVTYKALLEADKMYEANMKYDKFIGLTKEGKYTLTPVDAVGLEGESVTFYIYRQTPEYTVSGGDTVVKKDVAISWKVSDNEMVAPIVSVTMDGINYNATYNSTSKEYIGEVINAFGEHTFVVSDAAGNRSVIMVTINNTNSVCINGVSVQVKMQAYYQIDKLFIGKEKDVRYEKDDVIIFALPTQAVGAECATNGLLGYRTLDPENSNFLVDEISANQLNGQQYDFVEQKIISEQAIEEVKNIGGTVVVFVVTKDIANGKLGYSVGTNPFMEDPLGWTLIIVASILALIPSYRIFFKKKVRII